MMGIYKAENEKRRPLIRDIWKAQIMMFAMEDVWKTGMIPQNEESASQHENEWRKAINTNASLISTDDG